MITYRLQKNRDGSEAPIICREHDDGRLYFIPLDAPSGDLDEYKAWLAEGNEPLPAHEI